MPSEHLTQPYSIRRSKTIRAYLDFFCDLDAFPAWVVCKLYFFLKSLAINFFPERIADDTGLHSLFPERYMGADTLSAYGTYIHMM